MSRLSFVGTFIAVVAVSCVSRNDNTSSVAAGDSIAAELKPVVRPVMSSVRDYYPPSTRSVAVNLRADSSDAFDGDRYTVYALNDSVRRPVDIWFNMVYSKIVDESPEYEQTVVLNFDSQLRPGHYLVARACGNDTLYSEFRIVDEKEVKNMLKRRITEYFSNDNKRKNDTVATNVYMYGLAAGDTIEVALRHDSPKMRNLFYKEVLNYSALKFAGPTEPEIYTGPVVTDTMGVSMTTVESVYPDTIDSVKFLLHNGSGKILNYGTPYTVARLIDGKWVELYQNGVWNMPLFVMSPGSSSEIMTARLHRYINDISKGEYLIYKDVYFDGEREKSWNICARFSIR